MHSRLTLIRTGWKVGAYKCPHFSRVATEKKPPQGCSLPDLITRLKHALITLRVFDDRGIVLQRVPLVLQTLVDDNGAANGMNSNDLLLMELAPYRAFLAAKGSVLGYCVALS
jgi:hypothetical protein